MDDSIQGGVTMGHRTFYGHPPWASPRSGSLTTSSPPDIDKVALCPSASNSRAIASTPYPLAIDDRST
ncbi:MAG: hypothetical protein U1U88_000469 [Lawsonella clevelandensis]